YRQRAWRGYRSILAAWPRYAVDALRETRGFARDRPPQIDAQIATRKFRGEHGGRATTQGIRFPKRLYAWANCVGLAACPGGGRVSHSRHKEAVSRGGECSGRCHRAVSGGG